MKVSLNWLNDYVDLKDISTGEIVDSLTMSGLEVEDVVDQKEMYKNFIVGFVEKKEKHPNADRLSVCIVATGKESVSVICGARNVERGQKVVFAPVGTIIPKGNVELKKAKIRGVESSGMICAEDELLLSEDHSGIMVLDPKLKEGTPIVDALNLDDVLMEIAITPNRPDALSHLGVARDLSAIFKKDLHLPKINLKESNIDINDTASIEIADEKNCPRYSSLVVLDVKVDDSPDWLKNKISSIGLRPINNIVDITNYVMYETGQPLHAFDLDRLNGKKIIVKSTKRKSEFTTLDSKERELLRDTLMICDAEKDVAIAGVMGGENSEIYYDTKNVLIESAYFDPSSIRKTSKYMQLSTDASYRFERGTDPNNTLFAAERTAALIGEIADGKIAKGSIDVYPKMIEERIVKFRLRRLNKILGFNVSAEDSIQIFEKLGFGVKQLANEELKVTVPTYRPDIEQEVDLIEEIARISGYHNVPTIPRISITLDTKHDETVLTNNVRDFSNALGLSEIINNPLQPELLAKSTGDAVKLSNPLSMDMAYLRTSLLPGALSVVARNLNRGEKNLSLFEIGNVFNLKEDKSDINSFDDFDEEEKIIFILSGKKVERDWFSDTKEYDFYDLKGIVNSFLSKISLDNLLNDSYYSIYNNIYEFYLTKNFKDREVGLGGKIRSDVLKKFDIEQNVYCFEFNFSELKQIPVIQNKYSEPLKYPKVFRDFAFVFDKTVLFDDVRNFIQVKSSKLLKNVNVFDIFESKELGQNKRSMAFELEYFDMDRTLTEEEVEKDFEKLIKLVSKQFNAKLRGN
ncbi:MAG: phenylalanine--tRNA ligase subunit beta [Ignavibacterium sp.]|nr:MAG: phenylalanine--tRNA ligase subunit beta [Ignavibacterium sp.]